MYNRYDKSCPCNGLHGETQDVRVANPNLTPTSQSRSPYLAADSVRLPQTLAPSITRIIVCLLNLRYNNRTVRHLTQQILLDITPVSSYILSMQRLGQTDRPVSRQLNAAVTITALIILRPVRSDSRGNSQLCTAVIITALLRHPYWLSIDGRTVHGQVPYGTLPIQPLIRHIGKQRYNNLPIR